LLACIAQIHSNKELLEDCQFEISVIEIADLAKLKQATHVYRLLEETADKLSKRQIIINDPDPDKPKTRKRTINWISYIDYQPGEGKVIIQFTTGIIPYLSQLSREFTQYKLKNITQFKSTYSIRLYEMLVQWLSVGKREIEVDWLKKQLQVEDNYPRVGDFKNRVIDVAIKEINEHSNIWVKYGQRKAGRTITHFIFTFDLKETPRTPKDAASKNKPLVPLFTGHPDYKVDTDAVLADHETLKIKPIPKSKIIDDVTKQKIAGLKKATKAK
jgi:plasmid replication initiation protein